MPKRKLFHYTEKEELANWITHAVGIIFGVYALITLCIDSQKYPGIKHLVSSIVYGLSVIALFTASTFYHYTKNLELKVILRKADHICIYFLIAGTYTPFLYLTIGGDTGFNFGLLIWGISIVGTVFKVFYTHKFDKLSLLAYLVMGWMAVLLWTPLSEGLSHLGLMELVYGGLFFTVGAIFYAWEKLPYHHMIWHLFVLAGSITHFLAIQTIFV